VRASPEPVLLALDGAEAADGASMGLLQHALQAEGGRWLVVSTSNPAWDAPWPVVATIPLHDLNVDELRRLLAAAMGDEELDPAAGDALVLAASGNPLALTELTWAYRQTGELPKKRAG